MLLFKIVSNLEYVKPHSETIKLVKIDSLRLITYRKYKASNYFKKQINKKISYQTFLLFDRFESKEMPSAFESNLLLSSAKNAILLAKRY